MASGEEVISKDEIYLPSLYRQLKILPLQNIKFTIRFDLLWSVDCLAAMLDSVSVFTDSDEAICHFGQT